MGSGYVLSNMPDLHNPRLIVGVADVGHVSLRAVDYLKNKLGAQEFGHIEPRRFSMAPWVSVRDGVIEEFELLRSSFSFCKDAAGGKDLVIFKSEQPTARPYEYAEAVLDVARELGVSRVYIVGSFGAAGVTHLEPPAVLGVVNMAHLRELLVDGGIQPYPQYKGIGTIHSSLLWFAKERKVEGVGLWCPIPHYVARLPLPWNSYPRATLCLVDKLNAMEGLQIETGELQRMTARTEDEMRKLYDQLYEEAKDELVFPAAEEGADHVEDGLARMSDEDVKRMMKDIEDFFRKRPQ
ncbi:MAG: PAC2 family protein [Dehalococcoidia bacterium]|nr:PAC2 family protein [Dehalococcoidia bacterium]